LDELLDDFSEGSNECGPATAFGRLALELQQNFRNFA